MINIANLLITRRCELNCTYCRISGNIDYSTRPLSYPRSGYYDLNEKSGSWWGSLCAALLLENPNIFFIVYGGEPFQHDGLEELVEFLNLVNANYTIISNCHDGYFSNERRERFFTRVNRVRGFTASVDPRHGHVIASDWNDEVHYSYDEDRKSDNGFDYLKELIAKDRVDDPVAEITCTSENINELEDTVARLDAEGIYSDITFVDTAKNDYYDFSNVTEESMLVRPCQKVRNIFKRLAMSDYKIHMKKTLLDRIYDILPSNLDCGIDRLEKPLHSITIDADGAIRLCLRIRGIDTPQYSGKDIVDNQDAVREAMIEDKKLVCEYCNHTCYVMSQMSQKGVITHGE